MKKIVHFKPRTFLEITENWIFDQIVFFETYSPIFYTNKTKNLEIFQINNIKTFTESFKEKVSIINFFDRLFKKLFNIQPSIFFNLLRDKPLLIHAHYGDGGATMSYYKRFFKIPLITTFYGADLNELINEDPSWIPKYKNLFKHGDIFLAEGNYMKYQLTQIGCPKEKIFVQKLGISTENIPFKKRIFNGRNLNILISGRFVDIKGIPDAIQAIGIFSKIHPELIITTTILGDSNDREESKKEKILILKKIKEYSLQSNVLIKGLVPHNKFIDELYKNDIFFHPSKFGHNKCSEGGAPVSIIEATASGMIVVATNHCDIPEIVLNNKSGFLTEENNPELLVESLEKLLANQNKWGDMGIIGRKHIKNNYDAKTQSEKIEKIYDNLLESFPRML